MAQGCTVALQMCTVALGCTVAPRGVPWPWGVPWPSRGVPWPLYEEYALELSYLSYSHCTSMLIVIDRSSSRETSPNLGERRGVGT